MVLNNHEAQGRYDPTKLADLLGELEPLPEFAATAFGRAALAALRFAPSGDAIPEPPADRVEVTLVTDTATFAALEPKLDAVVREFDLVTHVRRGG